MQSNPRIGPAICSKANLLLDGNLYRAVRHFEEAARLDPTDEDTAHVARHNRTLTHWLQWPLYAIERFGRIKFGFAYLALFLAASFAEQFWLATILLLLYIFLVVYSWTIAPLARWWMQRRIR